MLRLALFLAVASVIGGCAAFSPAPGTTLAPDIAKMAVVERAAAQAGVRVYWIHPPVKAVPATGS